eukprot:CAMPEP_0185589660 /NCGR_PEP_ID=MMETSP0434-20130131/57924_1 /TAXON_ID=626734 ORGANISM="Favella taraikaensis, Strain Fe Narragansett Bay" /NCGR_SAMPLE_ID=MMETSP0434 /ASSEMBLY_ACC=CAM_ASM_000379 /LENGTH=164 /DNA_ID=CAMNT_0028213271 /DNA_START=1 /DNA_END=495 /DNA_ORIENTATION=+
MRIESQVSDTGSVANKRGKSKHSSATVTLGDSRPVGSSLNQHYNGGATVAALPFHLSQVPPQQKKEIEDEEEAEGVARELKAVIYAVFGEADEDGNGDLDINECRHFCKKLLNSTYPEMVWDEERFKQGFYNIDVDKGGSIDIDELFEIILKNAERQSMIVGVQ